MTISKNSERYQAKADGKNDDNAKKKPNLMSILGSNQDPSASANGSVYVPASKVKQQKTSQSGFKTSIKGIKAAAKKIIANNRIKNEETKTQLKKGRAAVENLSEAANQAQATAHAKVEATTAALVKV